MNKKMTRVIGIVAVLMLLMVACVGAASAVTFTINSEVSPVSAGNCSETLIINDWDGSSTVYIKSIEGKDTEDFNVYVGYNEFDQKQISGNMHQGYVFAGIKINGYDAKVGDTVSNDGTITFVASSSTATLSIGSMNNGHISMTDGGDETTTSITKVKTDTPFTINGNAISVIDSDSVPITRYAVANNGYEFDKWQQNGTDIESSSTKPEVGGVLTATFKVKPLDSDTLYVNDADTTHKQNLYKDGSGNYYAYEGNDVVIPIYLNGSDDHLTLNGYDVQVRATDGSNTLTMTTNEVENLLTAWTNGDKTATNNIVSISYSNAANNGTVDISPTAATKTSLLSVKITGDQVTYGKNFTLYVEPDAVNSDAKGTGSTMFSGFNKDMGNLTIADIDNGLFDAANTNKIVMTFTVKDLAELTKYTVSDYAGDYTKQDNRVPVDLLWEREVGTDAGIVATFDSAVGTNPTVASWNIIDAESGAKLSDYMNDITGTFGEGKNTVSGSFTTKQHDAPAEKVSGSLTLKVNNDESAEISDTHPVSIQKWLNESGNNYGTVTIGNDMTVTLKVMGNKVNTSETGSGTTGWNTYATFPAFSDKMTSGTWTPVSTTYKVGDDTVTYVITNGGTEGKMTVGGNLYITSNDVNDSSKMITVTMTGKKLGDATMNGAINIGDSSAMGVDILRAAGSKLLTGENKLYADVDKSGSIDVTDVQKLNKYLVGSDEQIEK